MSAFKYHVFLSHNWDDKPAVEELAHRLRQREGIEPWLDKWHLIPGASWQPAIEQALADCGSCAVIIGPSGIGSWQHEEMRAAIDRRVKERRSDYRVIPVLLPGAQRPEKSRLPDFLTSTTWVEFRHSLDEEEAFHRLVCGIQGREPGHGPGGAAFEGECPYRGLEAFDEGHAKFFFGREARTEWLLDALRPGPQGRENRFLAIIGPSGSGKSSLARAGLVRALRRGGLDGSADWPIVTCQPHVDPLESLAVALACADGSRPGPADVRRLIQDFRGDANGLHLFTRLALRSDPPTRRLVLLIDQFEEVFTLGHDDAAQRAFIDNLLYAATVAGGQTVVALTLRADFYGKCASYPTLAAALADHQELVGPMTEDELRRAIERPALLVGCEFAPGLVERLMQEVKGQAGALPLLQYALLELWKAREGRRLTNAAYEAIGGLRGALENRANAVLADFTAPQRELCRRIFLRLTQPGEGTEDTKRRASVRELAPAGGDAEAIEGVLSRLAAARLITTEGDERHPDEGFVEVAHEALVRGWSELRRWIDADRAGLRTHRRLTEAAGEWDADGRHRSYLYAGARLAVANEWAEAHPEELNPLEAEFLAASLEWKRKRESDEVEAARRLAEEAEARRRAEEERALESERREKETQARLRAEEERALESDRRAEHERARARAERKRRQVVVAMAVTGLLALATGGVAVRYIEMQQEAQEGLTRELVNKAIGRAQSLSDLAAKAPVGEPAQRERAATLWQDVLASVDQAERTLARGAPSAQLRNQAGAVLAEVRREAADAARDRTMLDRLEDARYAKSRITSADLHVTLTRPYLYGSAAAGLYEKAFRDDGIDIGALEPAAAAARIRARPIRRHLVAALDDWYQVNPASDRAGRLLAIAVDADDDAMRKRIRAAIGRKDRAELLRIADGPDAASLSPQTALLLAFGLESPRDTNDSARVVGLALKQHPDDFWLNDLAGLYFTYSDPPRMVEALAAFRSALAARKGNEMVLTNIGTAWFRLGDYDRAVAYYSESMAKNRGYQVIHEGLLEALINQGDLPGAEAAARDWVRHEPKSPAALGSLAFILSQSGRIEESERLIKDAVRHLSPDSSDNLLLVRWLSYMNKDEDAIPYLRQAAKAAVSNGEVLAGLGSALIKVGKLDEGMAALRRSVELTPRSAACWNALALGLMRTGQFKEALDADRQAIARDPFQPILRVTYASHLRLAGQPREALMVIEEAIRLGPRNGFVLAEQGLCLASLGRYADGVRCLKEAINLQPWNGVLHENLGDILKANRESRSAVAAYEAASRLMPGQVARLSNAQGNAYFDLQDYPAAMKAYRRAIEGDEKNPTYMANLANTLRLAGRRTEAIELYLRAVDLAPDNPTVLSGLAWCYFEVEQFDKAVATQQKVVRLNPTDATALRGLAVYTRRAGRPGEALPIFDAAIKLRPNWANPYWARGRALADLGRHEEAIRSLQRAEDLLPNNRAEAQSIAWQVERDLGISLRETGRFADALAALRRAKELAGTIASPSSLHQELREQMGSLDQEFQRCERLVELDATLTAVRGGTVTVTDPAAALELAVFAQRHKHWPYTAAKLAETAFTSNPDLADDQNTGHRMTFARAAASAGLGDDAGELDPAERTRLRKLALGWLRAELADWAERLDTAPSQTRVLVEPTLQRWQADPDLAGVREPTALEKLPETERADWRALWSEVDGLLAKSRQAAS